jgi:hypothetical protein
MSTTFSLVVYVKPPQASPATPSTIRMMPKVLFICVSFLYVAGQAKLLKLVR